MLRPTQHHYSNNNAQQGELVISKDGYAIYKCPSDRKLLGGYGQGTGGKGGNPHREFGCALEGTSVPSTDFDSPDNGSGGSNTMVHRCTGINNPSADTNLRVRGKFWCCQWWVNDPDQHLYIFE